MHRRRYLAIVGSAASAAASLAGCIGGGRPEDVGESTPTPRSRQGTIPEPTPIEGRWPTFGYDLANTGYNPESGAVGSDPSERWRFETRGGVFGGPAVDERGVYVGSLGGRLYRIDPADGTWLWTFDVAAEADADLVRISSTPTVADGTVYVAATRGVAEGVLYAIDAAEGTEQWSRSIRGRLSSPAVTDDAVYLGSEANYVFGLDRADGSERWALETGASVVGAPAVTDDGVYAGALDSTLYAIDPAEGTETWTWSLDHQSGFNSAPAVADGTVFVGARDGTLYTLGAAEGSPDWRFDTADQIVAGPAVAEGTVYVGSMDGRVYAADAADGTEQWHFGVGDGDGIGVRASPAVADGTVYVGSTDGSLYALDAAGGSERWRRDLGASVRAAPAVADGTVFVGTEGSQVAAIGSG